MASSASRGLLEVGQQAVQQDLPDVAQQDAADQVGHKVHGTEQVGALDAAGQHQRNGKGAHIDEHSAHHGKDRRKAEGVQEGGILKYCSVVLDAYKGGLGNGSEPLEGQINAPDKGGQMKPMIKATRVGSTNIGQYLLMAFCMIYLLRELSDKKGKEAGELFARLPF